MAVATALVVLVGGCGGGGVGEGATVAVYVSAPLHGVHADAGRALCRGVRRELARADGTAGGVGVRVACLDNTGGGERWSLAAVGANARRATEDSTTVGYIGELNPAATRFSRPIVEAAGIRQLSALSGRVAMAGLLRAIDDAGTSTTLRKAVYDALR